MRQGHETVDESATRSSKPSEAGDADIKSKMRERLDGLRSGQQPWRYHWEDNGQQCCRIDVQESGPGPTFPEFRKSFSDTASAITEQGPRRGRLGHCCTTLEMSWGAALRRVPEILRVVANGPS